jgi:predicted O-methyltransferase YrrM
MRQANQAHRHRCQASAGSWRCWPPDASATRELFAGDPRVQVITGDAFRDLPQRAPFDLIFADGGGRGASTDLVSMARVGGHIVNDDLTPQRALSPDSPFLRNDPKRRAFFEDPRLISVEVVLPDLQNSLLFGTRVS